MSEILEDKPEVTEITVQEPPEEMTCEFCGKTFTDRKKYSDHMRYERKKHPSGKPKPVAKSPATLPATLPPQEKQPGDTDSKSFLPIAILGAGVLAFLGIVFLPSKIQRPAAQQQAAQPQQKVNEPVPESTPGILLPSQSIPSYIRVG